MLATKHHKTYLSQRKMIIKKVKVQKINHSPRFADISLRCKGVGIYENIFIRTLNKVLLEIYISAGMLCL